MNKNIIIDRRLNGKGKSTVNRERFLRRYRKYIQRAVNEAINKRSITDTKSGESITIAKKHLTEAIFKHGPNGYIEQVLPGNREFIAEDRIKRSSESNDARSGPGKTMNQGEGLDDFVFGINRNEFLEYLFDDLELPNLMKKENVKNHNDTTFHRSGFINAGTPNQLSVVRSLRHAYARRIALSSKDRRLMQEIKNKLLALDNQVDDVESLQNEKDILNKQWHVLKNKIDRLPFLDKFDLKYMHTIRIPSLSSQAVMFCIMDVSGSMTNDIKDMAKRFFFLLYLFLQKKYESVDIVFIRHHAEARECNEEEFFYSRETGGTVVSSALKLAHEIIEKRYKSNEWNIYLAQASDGDNWEADSPRCSEIIREKLIQHVQYYAYVEITDRHHQNLWFEYEKIQQQYANTFSMAHIPNLNEVYPVFRSLFEKKIGVFA
ncbi:MAG: YeaH/YhbH family protein [Endozoicomonadaceae bacterium]|nr:YeaH/YhbH family protein [Endozoicomonadaceae bacterium]